MSGRRGAETDQLGRLRTELGRRQRAVRHAGDDAADAIERFLARSTEVVPHLWDHRRAADRIADELDAVAERVEATHAALVAADRWVVVTLLRWGLEAHGVASGVQDARDVLRSRSVLPAVLRARTTAQLPGEIADAYAGWHWRTMGAATLDDARQLLRGGAPAGGDASWLARVGSEASRARLRAVGRIGGRVLTVVGVVTGGVDVATGIRDADTERVVTGALGAASSVAMMSGIPPVQLAGAVVATGLLVYEYRHEVGAALDAVGDRVTDALDGARRFLSGLF